MALRHSDAAFSLRLYHSVVSLTSHPQHQHLFHVWLILIWLTGEISSEKCVQSVERSRYTFNRSFIH